MINVTQIANDVETEDNDLRTKANKVFQSAQTSMEIFQAEALIAIHERLGDILKILAIKP